MCIRDSSRRDQRNIGGCVTNNYTCAPGSRCKKIRECDTCARIRQAQHADHAQAAHALTGGVLTYAVVIPSSIADIQKIRTQITSRIPARGGMWAVQIGEEVRGLHMDLIYTADDHFDATDLAAKLSRPAQVWAQPIPPADLRKIAAYATRRAAMPPASEYSGHLAGWFGGWRSMRQVLLDGAATPASPIPAPVAVEIVAAEIRREDAPVAPTARAAALQHIAALRAALRAG